MENNNKQPLSQNENLQTAFRELCNNTNAIKNTIYWLDKYLETNESNQISKIKELLETANTNIELAFDELSDIVEN
jgi:hypothetical protein